MFKKLLLQCFGIISTLAIGLFTFGLYSEQILEWLTHNHNWSDYEENVNQIADWGDVFGALFITLLSTFFAGLLSFGVIGLMSSITGYTFISKNEKPRTEPMSETQNNLMTIQKLEIAAIAIVTAAGFLTIFPWSHDIIHNNTYYTLNAGVFLLLTTTCVKRKYIKHIIKKSFAESTNIMKQYERELGTVFRLANKVNLVRNGNEIYVVKYEHEIKLKNRTKIAKLENEMFTPA